MMTEFSEQDVNQLVVVDAPQDSSQMMGRVALFDESGSSLSGFSLVKVTVTPTQFLNLHNEKVVLVPGKPGVITVPVMMIVRTHDGSTPYTFSGTFSSNDPNLCWRNEDDSDDAFLGQCGRDVLGQTVPSIERFSVFEDFDEYAYPLGGNGGIEGRDVYITANGTLTLGNWHATYYFWYVPIKVGT